MCSPRTCGVTGGRSSQINKKGVFLLAKRERQGAFFYRFLGASFVFIDFPIDFGSVFDCKSMLFIVISQRLPGRSCSIFRVVSAGKLEILESQRVHPPNSWKCVQKAIGIGFQIDAKFGNFKSPTPDSWKCVQKQSKGDSKTKLNYGISRVRPRTLENACKAN